MQPSKRRAGPLLAGTVSALFLAVSAFSQATPVSQRDAYGSPGGASAGDVALLKQQVADEQQEIQELRAALCQLQRRLDENSPRPLSASRVPAAGFAREAGIQPVLLRPLSDPASRPASGATALPAASSARDARAGEEKPPLTLSIGDAQFTLGGFVDATAIFRSTNSGGIGTSFGAIPFSNTAPGRLSELRLSAQNSRLSLLATSGVNGWNVSGYVESDFLGNAPANLAVTSNSNTLRMRLYWMDLTRSKFEILAGQSWSLLNPGRNGISPMPGDVFYGQNMDTNYQVGLTWSRDLQFRFVYHPTPHLAAALSLENPQQYVAAVTFPPNFSPSQVDTGTNANAPNLHPDVVGKIAYDPTVDGKHLHVEAAGLLSSFRILNPFTNLTTTSTGGGGAVNLNLEVVRNIHAIVNTFYSDGGGRWIFGLGPDFVVNGEGRPSLVHASSTVDGFEYQFNPRTLLYAYYGGAYFGRTTAIYVDPKTGKSSFIGFGYPGSPSSQNKSVQEGTFGVIQTFWKNPRYGALQLITQCSYLSRAPWFVAAGTPKNAHASLGYADLRYTLP